MEINFDHFYLNADQEEDFDGPEFIPLMSPEEEEEMEKEKAPDVISILPLRNTVLFPGVVIPITLGRDKSISLINEAYKEKKLIGVCAQHRSDIETPSVEDIHDIGTMARIIKILKMPDGNTTAILQGKGKFKILNVVDEQPFMRARVSKLPNSRKRQSKEMKALVSSIREMAIQIVEISPNIPTEATFALKNIESSNFLVNFISSNLNISAGEKQKLLEIRQLKERTEKVMVHLDKELQMLELKNQIQSKVKGDLDKQQREYFLQQQMRAIQEELGGDTGFFEIEDLRAKGEKKDWPNYAKKSFNKELDKLARMNPSAPDYSVGVNYAELLLELPWNHCSKDNFDIEKAKAQLDKDHFGLQKVKERILEYLAVLKLRNDMKSPILCLYGPPGVGKTSLGKSIAEAVGRKYVRMSLGGLHDESELRGHRKTYIGAMPGRIIQSLKKSGTSNPIMVLDEIDKIGSDFRGDPSSALLEILDPEQNKTFYDNYVELDYDLSKILFIATANRLDTIQPALLDRMEMIEINGYTVEEKIQIAKKYLIPKQRKAHGIKSKDFKISDKNLEAIIAEYTRESGVRGLEKKLASLSRKIDFEIVKKDKATGTINLNKIHEILGSQRMEKEQYQDNSIAGVVTGLAWTSVGGEILFVECQFTEGKGKVTLTGQLGDVMKESATTAITFLKSHSAYLEINPRIFDYQDIHIHFPAGAVPKDGPSAGITILTSLASMATQRKVKSHLAMTGEITLRGKVLPVGGIKEKVLAAKRAGIKEIVLSKANQKDVENIEKNYTANLNFHYVENMLQVLDIALTTEKVKSPRTWKTEGLDSKKVV
ncbi:MAG: endopeptidase La [Bacteroidota bacterium]|nr:endopeptidase La [Bacteroidota bacterium]